MLSWYDMECITVMIDNFLYLPWPCDRTVLHMSPSLVTIVLSISISIYTFPDQHRLPIAMWKYKESSTIYPISIWNRKEEGSIYIFFCFICLYVWLFKLNKICSFAKKFFLTVCGHGCWPYCYLFAEIWSQHIDDPCYKT